MSSGEIKFYSKRNCAACMIVRTRFDQWGIAYDEIFNHHYSAPMIEYHGDWLRPPISTRALREFCRKHKLGIVS